jgi:hypothetical protein
MCEDIFDRGQTVIPACEADVLMHLARNIPATLIPRDLGCLRAPRLGWNAICADQPFVSKQAQCVGFADWVLCG